MEKTRLAVAAILGCVLAFTIPLHAQTIISGNISGTWSPSGNPYIVSDNATVQGGQTLTIQPGVVVWLGAGVSITVMVGNIQAIGTPSQRIIFQSPSSSQHWNEINLDNSDGIISSGGSTFTNRFTCCDFLYATNAISMYGNGGGSTVEIRNCSFSNCVSGIYSTIQGVAVPARLLIKNCIFSGNGTAVFLPQGGPGTATMINNTVVNCAVGVNATDPWDAQIESCIFKGCTSAVTVSGSLSRTVSDNDFFGNGTNFVGYPSSYGNPIILNRNGTPCDLLLNIFQDPQFVSATDFHLQGTSPCIDAGEGSAANFDNSFPPSLGNVTNDIGAYGGPNAGQWLVPAPSSFLTLAAARYIGVTINPPSAGHYELDYASALAGTNNWIQITNMDLSAPFLYTEPASAPARFYRAEKLY
jgi:hypothetical protein